MQSGLLSDTYLDAHNIIRLSKSEENLGDETEITDEELKVWHGDFYCGIEGRMYMVNYVKSD